MNGVDRKKYFFFDIDGTLTDGVIGERPFISEETKQTLQELEQAGHLLAIATGRPYFMTKAIAEEVNIHHLVCNGGNDIYIDDVCLHEEPLNREVALSIIHQCIEKKICFCVSTENTLVRYTHDEAFQRLVSGKHFLGELRIDPSFAYDRVKEYKRLFLDKNRIDEIDFHGMLVGSSYMEPYVIVEPDDKFHGIASMMNYLQAPLEDVVVFGDGINDVRMFEQAPFSIAMGNGIQELKEIADFVTHANNNDGIRFACEKFGWLQDDLDH